MDNMKSQFTLCPQEQQTDLQKSHLGNCALAEDFQHRD
jgi:hypothetical protein